MGRRLNLIIVPDESGQARRMKLSVFWIKAALIVVILLVLAFIAGAVTWTSLVRRALDYSRLEAENTRLENENKDIIRVAQEVDQNRQIRERILRSLGGHLELERVVSEGESLDLGGSLAEGLNGEYVNELLGENSYAVDRILGFKLPTQMPLEGFISQEFFEDYLFPARSHRGIDIAGKTGTPVKSAASGRVVFSGWTPYFGNCILVAHPGGFLTFYGHNLINLKDVRERVERGEPIAMVGTSGRSSAPHLHFEIWKDGIPVDPCEFVQPVSNQ